MNLLKFHGLHKYYYFFLVFRINQNVVSFGQTFRRHFTFIFGVRNSRKKKKTVNKYEQKNIPKKKDLLK